MKTNLLNVLIVLSLVVTLSLMLTSCKTAVETKSESSSLAESSATEAEDAAVSDEEGTTAEPETEAPTAEPTEPTTEFPEAQTQEYNPTDIDTSAYNYSFSLEGFSKTVSINDLNSYFDELQTIINESDFKLAVTYKNMDSGATIRYNADTDFLTCSTIKPIFVKSLLESGINLDEMVTKNKRWSGDTNYTASLANGTQISVRELMQRAVSYSDNTAYYLLHQYFSPSAFNQTQKNLGTSIRLSNSWIFTYTTANEALLNYEDIYNYIQNGGENGQFLKELMTADDVDVNMQIRRALSAKYTVAEKYGSEFNDKQFHACAIVFAESPYVLNIFTGQYPETEQSAEVFYKIAVVINKINTVLYNEA